MIKFIALFAGIGGLISCQTIVQNSATLNTSSQAQLARLILQCSIDADESNNKSWQDLGYKVSKFNIEKRGNFTDLELVIFSETRNRKLALEDVSATRERFVGNHDAGETWLHLKSPDQGKTYLGDLTLEQDFLFQVSCLNQKANQIKLSKPLEQKITKYLDSKISRIESDSDASVRVEVIADSLEYDAETKEAKLVVGFRAGVSEKLHVYDSLEPIHRCYGIAGSLFLERQGKSWELDAKTAELEWERIDTLDCE